MALTAADIDRLYAQLGVSEHPILKLPTADQVGALLLRPGGKDELIDHLARRQRRIKLADEDPLGWGWELDVWKDADRILKECTILALFGGNRAGKTVYAVKRLIQCADAYPGCKLGICSESEQASIATVQALTWSFIKPRYGHLNGKRDSVFKVNFSQGGGFTDRKLILPNGSEIHFWTYGQEPGDFEGWEFGAPVATYLQVSSALAAAGKFVPPNIAAVTDESCRLGWLQMLGRRSKFRKAHVLWPFTPVRGITPAVKELVGSSAITTESKPSELLPRKNMPDCPEGHMPFVRKCVYPGAMAIYFHTRFNPFGPSPGRTYYDEVKALLEGKASEIVERVAYGFARDSVARAFPTFGPWNIVKRSQLPAIGTNYFFCDPAGARKWFMLWCRVVPGTPKSIYIYRDWPDAQTYGEWAMATEREVSEETRRGWDGDPGPAQVGAGMGITAYKRTILQAETIDAGEALLARLKSEGEKALDSRNLDPYHRRMILRAWKSGSDLNQLREVIAERYIDSRAAAAEHIAEKGGTCITEEFETVQFDSEGKVTGPSMPLTPASGVDQEQGFTAVNELLDWNQEQPLVAVMNQPHLFVSEECQQVRWMFENYTGRAGEKGAAKDPADLVRYLALADLDFIPEDGVRIQQGRGF